MRTILLFVTALLACGQPTSTMDGGAAGGSTAGGTSGGGSVAGGSSAGGASGGGATAGGASGGSGAGGTAGGGSAGGSSGGASGGAVAGGAVGGGSTAGGASGGGSTAGGATTGPLVAFVGSGNGQLTAYGVNVSTGAMTMLGATSGGTNPSFLAFDVARGRLYAVNEGTPGQIAAFALFPDAGLRLINRASSQGAGPAHVSVHPSGQFVLAANYSGNNVAVLPTIPGDGGVGPATDTKASGTQAHQILSNAAGDRVYVPCKGSDHVAQYSFNRDAGTLSPLTPATVPTAAGAGPRHLAIHPSGSWAFLINEVNSTLTSLRIETDGRLTPVDTKGTLPSGFSGSNTTAEVQVHPNGQFVFGSNRGHNSIVTFSFDASNGTLTQVGHAPTGGATPRHFDLDPSGTLLLVANQGAGTVFALRINPATGVLTSLGQQATVNAPAFVGMTRLPTP